MHFDVSIPSSKAKDFNSFKVVSDAENMTKQALKIIMKNEYFVPTINYIIKVNRMRKGQWVQATTTPPPPIHPPPPTHTHTHTQTQILGPLFFFFPKFHFSTSLFVPDKGLEKDKDYHRVSSRFQRRLIFIGRAGKKMLNEG